ncbi:S-norcoclaurine synthase 1-like [Dioscorea cayenensis subsp. rotundata]|uniref:S-norcoclaurine synthase 1-like n=1 Tax=Dioscorea cayennensis subsp. rotundata TaxID=55577 RepID=A0AB40CQI8_DIOCR|nr:S-norcoclaurine synthase 1-like [Dioscorea cayenensis subsp. rotundata]
MVEAGNDNWNLKNTVTRTLPVPNVQSIADASDNCTEIPEKYVIPEINDSLVLNGAAAGPSDLPIIDFSRLCEQSEEEIAKLSLACEDWGYFLLINHGVPDEVIENMKVAIIEFFRLPLEEKKVYAKQPNTGFEGYAQTFVISEKPKVVSGEKYILSTRTVARRNMKLWTQNPPTFKDALDQFTEEIQKVANTVFESIGKSLKLDKFIDNFKDCQQSVRINYYPPCPHASNVLGIPPHTDTVGLTVVLQVNEVHGLQIKKNGVWLPINPLPGALIVNSGDIIEIMSNGKYKSLEHRAVVNSEQERFSIATFHGPRADAQIGPLPAETPAKSEAFYYKTVSFQDYSRMVFAHKDDGKNILDYMKLEV